jgi:hypothetical protein
MTKGEAQFGVVSALLILFAMAGSFHSCHVTKQAKIRVIQEGATPAEAHCLFIGARGSSDGIVCDRVFNQ